MAELMDQSEIDALLNSSLSAIDEDTGIGGEPAADTPGPTGGKRTKIYTHKEDKNQRFSFPYHSPIVKRRRFVLNPTPEADVPEDVPVVRTLANYVEFVKFQRTQSML
jgi:hypothetical protein